MAEICQTRLPLRPWAEEKTRRLPGLNLVAPGDWIQVDDAYAAQLAHKAALLADEPGAVLRVSDTARAACGELLDRLLDELDRHPAFSVRGDTVTCPDGRQVKVDPRRPLETCAALVQEDLCLMEKPPGGDEHVLTAALLAFPASWALDQKFLKPLIAIHEPVAQYDGETAKRVQRLFDFIQVDKPMWRANYLVYSHPELHQPRREEDRRNIDPNAPKWMRVERQSLVKLPRSGAVVFSIHTYVVPFSRLAPEDQDAFS